MHFGFLYAVFLLPVLLLGLWGIFTVEKRTRDSRLKLLADPHLLKFLLPKGAGTSTFSFLPFAAFSVLCGLALMRPQWGFTLRESTRRGADIVIALDLSQSMLSEDTKPNRLERAKREIYDLLGELKGDRVGLISFAGAAFIDTPLTLDYGAFRMFVENTSPSAMPLQGTNIELAIKKAVELFQADSKKSRSKALLLISDGEELDGALSQAGRLLKENSIQLFIMGVGTENGGAIPQDPEYKRDGQGQLIVSRLNEKALTDFAKENNGVYVHEVTTDDDITELLEKGLRKNAQDDNTEIRDAKVWNEYFQFPVALALLLLPLCWRENRKFSSLALLIFACLCSTIPDAQAEDTTQHQLREASRSLSDGQFEKAEKGFAGALKQTPGNPLALLGKGSAEYRLGKFSDAAESFSQAVEAAESPKQKTQALYDLANSLVQLGDYEKAIDSYKKAQAIEQRDPEIIENLRYAEKLLKQQQDEKKKEEEEKQQKQKQEEEKKKKDKNQSEQSQEQKDKQENQEQQEKSQNSQPGSPQTSPTPTPAATPTPDEQDGASPTPSPNPSETPASDNNSQGDASQPKAGETPKDEKDSKGKENGKEESPTASPSPTPEGEALLPTSTPTPDGSSTPLPSPDADQESQESGSAKKQAGKASDSKEKSADEKALEMLLGSIEEKGTPSQAYRLRDAIEQLRANGQKRPKKDW